jgi:hypothetical protein
LPSALRYLVDDRQGGVDSDRPEPSLLLAPPVHLDRPIRTGVIHNPLSFRNRRGNTLQDALDVMAAHRSIQHH